MSAKWLFRGFYLCFAVSAVCGFEVVNMLVSLKYETDRASDCISTVSGLDLCAAIRHFEMATVGCFLLAVALLVLGASKQERW
jgi:hypothetical protein